jgi:hypothetical protein
VQQVQTAEVIVFGDDGGSSRYIRTQSRAAELFTAPCGSSSHSCSIRTGCFASGTKPLALIQAEGPTHKRPYRL